MNTEYRPDNFVAWHVYTCIKFVPSYGGLDWIGYKCRVLPVSKKYLVLFDCKYKQSFFTMSSAKDFNVP